MSLQESPISIAGQQATEGLGGDVATQEDEPVAGSRLHGRALVAARTVWVLVALLAVTMFIVSLPAYYSALASHISDVRIGSIMKASDPKVLGIDPDAYAAYNVALEVALALIYSTIAVIIFARRSNEWMALLTSLAMITFGTASLPTTMTLAEVQPLWNTPQMVLNYIAWTSVGALFFLFPDGRFVPRFMVWAFVVFAVISVFWSFFRSGPFYPESWPSFVQVVLLPIVWLPPIFSQIYKYQRVLSGTQRQQAKWVVFGIAVSVCGGLLVTLPGMIDPVLGNPGPQRAFYEFTYVPALYIFLAVLPVSIGIAILRYRLYEIDLIINRALVYVPLTAILAGLYAALIAFLQKLFVAVTGEKSDAAIVITTLILTAGFTPIKNSLQSFVDRRFKDSPDATRKLNAFGEQVQSFVQMSDDHALAGRLLDEMVQAFQARSGAVYLMQDGSLHLTYACGEWHDKEARISVPLNANGKQLGLVQLGLRGNGLDYTPKDRETLQLNADRVAEAIWLAERARWHLSSGEWTAATPKRKVQR